MSRRLTDRQMMAHDRVDHVINGCAALVIGICNLLSAFSGEFDVLLKVWPFVFIGMNVYFFLHVEPWVRASYGSWRRSLAHRHTLEHRIMTAGGVVVGTVELALSQGWVEADVWRAFFPVGAVVFGVMFALHHWGEDRLADRQHRDIGFLAIVIGITMGAARFVDAAADMTFVWPVLFICQSYFFITYMTTPIHAHGPSSEPEEAEETEEPAGHSRLHH